MARKKKPEEHVNHERWLVSYADFITLLFATFTALFAISNADKEKFAALAKSLRNSFSTDIPTDVQTIGLKGRGLKEHTKSVYFMDLFPSQKKRGQNQASGTGRVGDDRSDPTDFKDELPALDGDPTKFKEDAEGEDPEAEEYSDGGNRGGPRDDSRKHGDGTGGGPGGWLPEFRQDIAELIRNSQLDQAIRIRANETGVTISLPADTFFEPESGFVKHESEAKLEKLFEFLQGTGYEISVEGHTDNTPLTGGRFDSLFDLSVRRASRLAVYMVEQYHYPSELVSAAGWGDAKPIDSNKTDLGRHRNRRVDIIVLGPPDR